MRAFALLLLVVLSAAAPASPCKADPDAHAEMRRLFAEYQRFKNTPAFRQHGYRIGGPFNKWSEQVMGLQHQPYGLILYSLCEVVPGDLWTVGVTAYKGETDAHRQRVEQAFVKCFARTSK